MSASRISIGRLGRRVALVSSGYPWLWPKLEKALLALVVVGCYRYFARLSDLWFAVRGDKAWSCSAALCSRDSNAWYDPTCDKARVVQARDQLIEGSLTALAKVVKMSIAWK